MKKIIKRIIKEIKWSWKEMYIGIIKDDELKLTILGKILVYPVLLIIPIFLSLFSPFFILIFKDDE